MGFRIQDWWNGAINRYIRDSIMFFRKTWPAACGALTHKDGIAGFIDGSDGSGYTTPWTRDTPIAPIPPITFKNRICFTLRKEVSDIV